MESNEIHARAERHIAQLKFFYAHLITYIFVNGMLFLINLSTGGIWWFYWPLLGWGIGLATHAIRLFGAGEKWEQREIRKYINKHS